MVTLSDFVTPAVVARGVTDLAVWVWSTPVAAGTLLATVLIAGPAFAGRHHVLGAFLISAESGCLALLGAWPAWAAVAAVCVGFCLSLALAGALPAGRRGGRGMAGGYN